MDPMLNPNTITTTTTVRNDRHSISDAIDSRGPRAQTRRGGTCAGHGANGRAGWGGAIMAETGTSWHAC